MDQMWSATFDPRNLAVRFGGRGKAYLCPYPYRHPKEPSRRVRCDSCGCAHRFDDWSDGISNAKTKNIYVVCFLAYDIGHCEGRSIDKGRIIGLDSSNLSKPPNLCLATGLAMAHSALVSRRFRKRSITSSSSSNLIGHEPFKKSI